AAPGGISPGDASPRPGAGETAATGPTASPAPEPPAPGSAAALFGRLRSLAGKWRGRSTKGWDETVTLRSIAGGSVVVMSSFDAHPGEEMITTFFMDADELQLRHYCIAGNQPHLAATAISPDGARAAFTFRDATNLPSRDSGHMDSVVYDFADPDHFTSRWTWYQSGRESFMEEIHYTRLP
ncbi:MAG TPA: hypothetical protein VNI57_11685, partial [Candidatus Saccharimonadales bacterium]|nr:hypothetical protein [Candidatus Saccharimonadales bacterium]